MTPAPQNDLFRQAAEAEEGMPVSAGGRISHVRAAVTAGRALYVDLSAVPENARAAVIDEIQELVRRASARTAKNDTSSASGVSSEL